MSLSLYEQETIINYNQEDKTATCYTYDKALIRKLDQLCQTRQGITLVRERDGAKEYSFPKKWVKVFAPKELSDEQRLKMAEKARERFHGKK